MSLCRRVPLTQERQHERGRTAGYLRVRSCPRISPVGFLLVWTFTYVRPARKARMVTAPNFATPWTPDRQRVRAAAARGPHNARATGPSAAGLPRWISAAVAGPLRLL